jgi:glycosyltransferase involved in cell wall biosynthesis
MSDLLILATALIHDMPKGESSPRVDYLELAGRLKAGILDYGLYEKLPARRIIRALETQLRSDLVLALTGYGTANRYRALLTMSERVGLPMASLYRLRARGAQLLFMFKAWSERQRRLLSMLQLLDEPERIIVHARSFRDYLESEFGLPATKVIFIPYCAVDQRFYRPKADIGGGWILSVGEARGRDYATLLEATLDVDAQVYIAASGRTYAREKQPFAIEGVPANVKIGGGHPPVELRAIYERSHFVVVPLYDVVFSAGVTTVLEAMAVGKAVIVSRSRGIVDYVIDGETGILVEPGNVAQLREAMKDLLANPDKARAMGERGRQRVEDELNLDVYVSRLSQLIQEVVDGNCR